MNSTWIARLTLVLGIGALSGRHGLSAQRSGPPMPLKKRTCARSRDASIASGPPTRRSTSGGIDGRPLRLSQPEAGRHGGGDHGRGRHEQGRTRAVQEAQRSVEHVRTASRSARPDVVSADLSRRRLHVGVVSTTTSTGRPCSSTMAAIGSRADASAPSCRSRRSCGGFR